MNIAGIIVGVLCILALIGFLGPRPVNFFTSLAALLTVAQTIFVIFLMVAAVHFSVKYW